MATVLASLAAARVAFPQTLVKPNLQGADLQTFIRVCGNATRAAARLARTVAMF